MQSTIVKIEDLRLDLKNPRIARASDQRHAARELWERNSEHILGLAVHIAQYGLNPSDNPYVVIEAAEYVVVEGNRRLLAIRYLNDTSLIPSEEGKRKVNSAIERFKYRELDSITCDVYKDRTAADLWIDLKHQGVGNGEGTVEWNSEQKYRRRISRGGRRTFGNELWWWAESTFAGDAELASLIKKGKEEQWTLMDRLAKEKFRKTFDFSFSDNGVESTRSSEQLKPVFRKIMSDIADGSLRARTIDTQRQRDTYIVSTLIPLLGETLDLPITHKPPAKVPSASEMKVDGSESSRPPSEGADAAKSSRSSSTLSSRGDGQPEPKKPRVGNAPETTIFRRSKAPKRPDEVDFIFPGLRWSELPGRIPDFAAQAQQVSIRKTPEVAGVCVRVLLDLLVDYFFSTHPTLGSKGSLEADLRAIMNEAQVRTSVTEQDAPWKSAYDSVNQANSSLSGLVSSAHGFVHNLGATGGETVVRDITRQLHPLVDFMVAFIIEKESVAAKK